MLNETRSVAAVQSAYAAYNRPSLTRGGEALSAVSTGKGFGVIEDKVDLSPQAKAMMAAAQAGKAGQTNDAQTEDKKAEKAAPSDPFRAYRGENGEISMEAMMQLEMLPPHLRKAGKLMRESASLREEISGMEKDPAADAEKLDQLRQEYAAAMGALWEELDKLGLTKKMKEQDMSMDDLLNAGLNGLTALDENGDSTQKIADDAHKVAKFATGPEKKPSAVDQPLEWAFDRGAG
jgi:hypothetical protein